MVCDNCKRDGMRIVARDCSVYAYCKSCDAFTFLQGDEQGENHHGYAPMHDDAEWEAWMSSEPHWDREH